MLVILELCVEIIIVALMQLCTFIITTLKSNLSTQQTHMKYLKRRINKKKLIHMHVDLYFIFFGI